MILKLWGVISMSNRNNIALIGFSGSGKSFLGSLLAKKIDKPFIDIDDLIEKYHPSSTCREIYQSYGADYFRYLESRAIHQMEEQREASIIATGGGSLIQESNAVSLKKHARLVFLRTPSYILLQRLQKRSTPPAYLNEMCFDDLLNQRIALYEKWADITLDLENMDLEEIMESMTGANLARLNAKAQRR
jgi:shikimate kinase